MPSQFIGHFTQQLIASPPSLSLNTSQVPPSSADVPATDTKHTLHGLLASFPQSQPLSEPQINHAVSVLSELESQEPGYFTVKLADAEENVLRNAVISRVAVALYAEAMDVYLTQATGADAESEWWADIERSMLNIFLYLLQTTPSRLYNMFQTIIAAVRSQNQPLSMSTFTPSSLARLFPTFPTSPFRPGILTTALFPHLTRSPLTITSFSYPQTAMLSADTSFTEKITRTVSYYFTLTTRLITYPLFLTRQECRVNRQKLESIRNERAEILGRLSQMRNSLSEILYNSGYEYLGNTQFLDKIQRFVEILDQTAAVDADITHPSPTKALARLSNETLPSLVKSHRQMLEADCLLRPRTLVLILPKIVFLPPLALFVFKSLYTSRASLREVANDAVETLKGFARGWLLEPIRDILKTVRSGAGDEEGVLVRRESVLADIDSLERMTLSLARDELKYNSEQLATLSRQIRLGDMTPIMEVYEEDIRTPLKSAIAGTLLRSAFIQVQKAKVDIDQALTGIDRLLKSQELTFAFVGVAPALAIVYLASGSLSRIWTGGKGRGRYGGLQRRTSVWDATRRIERLLITQPAEDHQLAALPSGLLFLSLARLRSYATECLPSNSRLRDGFLEDLDDLENPELGRGPKLGVVHRMWRCWGRRLGWEKGGEY